MKQQEVIDGLLAQAANNAKTAESLFDTSHYDWCLFLWQLIIEKVLKALIINSGDIPPYIHDLEQLANRANLDLDIDKRKKLHEITTFNIDARYDDYKLDFYKKANKDFASHWVTISKDIYTWLLEQF